MRIKSNRIESNRIELNRTESNRIALTRCSPLFLHLQAHFRKTSAGEVVFYEIRCRIEALATSAASAAASAATASNSATATAPSGLCLASSSSSITSAGAGNGIITPLSLSRSLNISDSAGLTTGTGSGSHPSPHRKLVNQDSDDERSQHSSHHNSIDKRLAPPPPLLHVLSASSSNASTTPTAAAAASPGSSASGFTQIGSRHRLITDVTFARFNDFNRLYHRLKSNYQQLSQLNATHLTPYAHANQSSLDITTDSDLYSSNNANCRGMTPKSASSHSIGTHSSAIHYELPTLPSKKVFGNLNVRFVERRRNELQAFLQQLCAHPIFQRSTELIQFMPTSYAAEFGHEQAAGGCGLHGRRIAFHVAEQHTFAKATRMMLLIDLHSRIVIIQAHDSTSLQNSSAAPSTPQSSVFDAPFSGGNQLHIAIADIVSVSEIEENHSRCVFVYVEKSAPSHTAQSSAAARPLPAALQQSQLNSPSPQPGSFHSSGYATSPFAASYSTSSHTLPTGSGNAASHHSDSLAPSGSPIRFAKENSVASTTSASTVSSAATSSNHHALQMASTDSAAMPSALTPTASNVTRQRSARHASPHLQLQMQHVFYPLQHGSAPAAAMVSSPFLAQQRPLPHGLPLPMPSHHRIPSDSSTASNQQTQHLPPITHQLSIKSRRRLFEFSSFEERHRFMRVVRVLQQSNDITPSEITPSPLPTPSPRDMSSPLPPFAPTAASINASVSANNPHTQALIGVATPTRQSFSVFTTTYNAGMQALAPSELPLWLPGAANTSQPHPPSMYDVICVSMQECTDSINVIASLIHTYLGVEHYTCVGQKATWAIHVVLFVRTSLAYCVSNVQTSSVSVGFLAGLMANKAGVAVSCNFHSLSCIFICAHLAAHTEKLSDRNRQFAEIDSFLVCGANNSCSIGSASSAPAALDACLRFDVCYFMGDLNYRVDMTAEQHRYPSQAQQHRVVLEMLQQRRLPQLFKRYDQLQLSQRAQLAFAGFHEGVVQFAPSYKFALHKKTNARKRTVAHQDMGFYRDSSLSGRDRKRSHRVKSSSRRKASSITYTVNSIGPSGTHAGVATPSLLSADSSKASNENDHDTLVTLVDESEANQIELAHHASLDQQQRPPSTNQIDKLSQQLQGTVDQANGSTAVTTQQDDLLDKLIAARLSASHIQPAGQRLSDASSMSGLLSPNPSSAFGSRRASRMSLTPSPQPQLTQTQTNPNHLSVTADALSAHNAVSQPVAISSDAKPNGLTRSISLDANVAAMLAYRSDSDCASPPMPPPAENEAVESTDDLSSRGESSSSLTRQLSQPSLLKRQTSIVVRIHSPVHSHSYHEPVVMHHLTGLTTQQRQHTISIHRDDSESESSSDDDGQATAIEESHAHTEDSQPLALSMSAQMPHLRQHDDSDSVFSLQDTMRTDKPTLTHAFPSYSQFPSTVDLASDPDSSPSTGERTPQPDTTQTDEIHDGQPQVVRLHASSPPLRRQRSFTAGNELLLPSASPLERMNSIEQPTLSPLASISPVIRPASQTSAAAAAAAAAANNSLVQSADFINEQQLQQLLADSQTVLDSTAGSKPQPSLPVPSASPDQSHSPLTSNSLLTAPSTVNPSPSPSSGMSIASTRTRERSATADEVTLARQLAAVRSNSPEKAASIIVAGSAQGSSLLQLLNAQSNSPLLDRSKTNSHAFAPVSTLDALRGSGHIAGGQSASASLRAFDATDSAAAGQLNPDWLPQSLSSSPPSGQPGFSCPPQSNNSFDLRLALLSPAKTLAVAAQRPSSARSTARFDAVAQQHQLSSSMGMMNNSNSKSTVQKRPIDATSSVHKTSSLKDALQSRTEPSARRAYAKSRLPSWCDRVLWRTPADDRITQLQRYYRCSASQASDHVPVCAVFTLHAPLYPVVQSYQYPASIYMSQLVLELHSPQHAVAPPPGPPPSAAPSASAGGQFVASPAGSHAHTPFGSLIAEDRVYLSFYGTALSESSRGMRTGYGTLRTKPSPTLHTRHDSIRSNATNDSRPSSPAMIGAQSLQNVSNRSLNSTASNLLPPPSTTTGASGSSTSTDLRLSVSFSDSDIPVLQSMYGVRSAVGESHFYFIVRCAQETGSRTASNKSDPILGQGIIRLHHLQSDTAQSSFNAKSSEINHAAPVRSAHVFVDHEILSCEADEVDIDASAVQFITPVERHSACKGSLKGQIAVEFKSN